MSRSSTLWKVYGYTYDGLLFFYPYQQLVKNVVSKAKITHEDRILDLGCGTGNQLVSVSQLTAGRIVGVDASGSMLRVARRKLPASVELIESDVVSYLRDQPTGAFDKIISTNVVYALAKRDEFWQQLFRVLAPRGVVVIATSVSTDSSKLIKDQIHHVGVIGSLVHPKLIGVFLCDALINMFGRSGHFEFPQEATIRHEIDVAGGRMSPVETAYSGVDIIFTANHS